MTMTTEKKMEKHNVIVESRNTADNEECSLVAICFSDMDSITEEAIKDLWNSQMDSDYKHIKFVEDKFVRFFREKFEAFYDAVIFFDEKLIYSREERDQIPTELRQRKCLIASAFIYSEKR